MKIDQEEVMRVPDVQMDDIEGEGAPMDCLNNDDDRHCAQ